MYRLGQMGKLKIHGTESSEFERMWRIQNILQKEKEGDLMEAIKAELKNIKYIVKSVLCTLNCSEFRFIKGLEVFCMLK